MLELEAKDFLVQKTAEQAALENIPFSDLEKRMMYFTESGEMREDAIALNDTFEVEHDDEEYEAKISRLLRHAYKRLRKENPQDARTWDQAVHTLRQGDHYLLVLWGEKFREPRSPYDSLKLLLAGVILAATMMTMIFLGERYGIRWKSKPGEPSWMPQWAQRLLGYSLILGLGSLLVRLLGTSSGTKKQ